MVLDTSALMAILWREPEAEDFVRLVASARNVISAATVLEAHLVMVGRKGLEAADDLQLLLHEIAVEIMPFDDVQLRIAKQAYEHYGKGRHPAALNFGDCISYALAKSLSEPLLYKGGDFAATDIEPAC